MLTAQTDGSYFSFVAIYTGSGLGDLTVLGCEAYDWYHRISFPVEAGVTYYFQLGSLSSWYDGDLLFNLFVTPPPVADFYWDPGDPSKFDTVTFCDNSYDPGYADFSEFWWNFGDGAQQGDYCTSHAYGADGDYTVSHRVVTTDGRSAETTKVVQVRTHDVAITRFIAPRTSFWKKSSAGCTDRISNAHLSCYNSIGQRMADFLKGAGSIILAVSVGLWALSFFPGGDINTSYLALWGRRLAPRSRLIGLDWRMAVALITSMLRSENTITIIPCIATVAAMHNESKSWRWSLGYAGLRLVVSVWAGILIYQGSRLLIW